ncbi:hypothetical protein TNIN_215071 [Trichonephila inaurata madagascariensis]|uniref:Uncharacterized protein n=1 Tax=Trichonephila inaurata madagascariensis TaxID=2747483 RepID=A0A8X6Y2R0_9ARAC|nr:hypothetical protein TNIN_215071 [Trichonephila inaurata madagascariensis]
MIWGSIMLDERMPLRVPSKEYGPEESGSDLGDLCKKFSLTSNKTCAFKKTSSSFLKVQPLSEHLGQQNLLIGAQ